MKERLENGLRSLHRAIGAVPRLRPVDAFVVGGRRSLETGGNVWLLMSRPGEKLIDFFLADDDAAKTDDPVPCACAGMTADGRVVIGEVNWDADRFLSELMDEGDAAAR